jgi:hypothetical protein
VRSSIIVLRGDVGGDPVSDRRGESPAAARRSWTGRGDLTMRGEPGDVCIAEILRCLEERTSACVRSSMLDVDRLRDSCLDLLCFSFTRIVEDREGKAGSSTGTGSPVTVRKSRLRSSIDCPPGRECSPGTADVAAATFELGGVAPVAAVETGVAPVAFVGFAVLNAIDKPDADEDVDVDFGVSGIMLCFSLVFGQAPGAWT